MAAASHTFQNSSAVENSIYKSFADNPIYFLANLQELGDPRTRHYPVVMNPLFVFPLVALYIYFVKVSGPRWMKDRQPFRIDGILRKKFNQITHLHVIHHVMVTLNVWFWVLFAPEGQVAFSLALNSFVHVVMYTYYLLANMGPSMRKYLWWKKYLTTLQIVQFVIIVVHMSIPLFVDCGFPRYLIFLGVAQTLLVLALFLNFYKKSYIEPERQKEAPKVTAINGDAVNREHKKDM
ncbi:hypothetical protein HPB52_022624 [Rhipicephalus sanguineus]|uniref:Elongation of very long chain fatty acids protein n=1 Tax=Rhipicephalus sanguineus TaxID=34632 RepID=A0A9D4T4V0_RHISA|nr:hypothetical protein HPB52_022624 [Rhipicephalus sanguineus]